MKPDIGGGRKQPGQAIDQPVFWEPSLAFLKYAIAGILIGCAAFLSVLLAFAPDQTVRALVVLTLMLVAVAAWIFLSRRRMEAAVLTLGIGTWVYVTSTSFFVGGVNSTSLIVYPLIILLVGWLVGTRAAVAIASLTVAATLGFVFAESSGFLPTPPPTPPAARWVIQCCVFVLSAVMIAHVVRSYRKRLAEVRKLGSDLALRTAALQASETDLHRAQAVAQVGSWVYDLSADAMRLSAETCRIFGLPEGTAGSHDTYISRVHPEDRRAVDAAWQAALKGGEAFDNEHRILVGKTIRWVRQIAELEFGADRTPVRSVGTTQDITERKRLEEALRAQTERLLIGQRTARMIILDWDVRHDELIWSDSPEWLRGPLPESGKYPLYVEQVHPEDRDFFLAVRAEGIDTLRPRSHEYRFVRTDGQVLWVRSQWTALPGADGKAARMIVALQDVTERKRAEAERARLEAQLRESQKMEALGTLAGGVAHDFSNIIAAILGNVELVRRAVGSPHPGLDSLEEIGKASLRAKALVQQILAFGRRQVVSRNVLSLAPVVEESMRLLRATLPAGIDLKVTCAADAPPVLADAMQIEQVLLNLCGNAWQAIEAEERPGAIEVRLEAYEHAAGGAEDARPILRYGILGPGRHARLTVRDNGPGMDATTLSRIFEPFFTTKPVGQGTGLGLAVVHGIMQENEGSIEVRSAPGVGTAFLIYLPAAAAVPEHAAGTAGTGEVRSLVRQGTGEHVLYVDDDDAIVLLITRMLEQHGYRVSGHTDAKQAIAAVRADPGRFDLVVTDYNMPGMSGLELARALRDIRSDLPVVLTSGYITEELRAKAPAAGVRELIYKPDTVSELCGIVARLATGIE